MCKNAEAPAGDSADSSSNCESSKRYKALVLSCIDPRMQEPVSRYLERRGLSHKYSHICLAGAGIAAVAPKLEGWHSTVWDNLSISLQLHKFPLVILIQHRDCGAAEEAYGFVQKDSDEETKLHRLVAEEFQRQLEPRHPQLTVEAVLMDLDGGVTKLLS